MNKKINYLLICFCVLFLTSGCATYRNAGMQGASDAGTVVGSAVGLPLGAVAVAIDETFKTAGGVTKQKRLYERYDAQGQVNQFFDKE